ARDADRAHRQSRRNRAASCARWKWQRHERTRGRCPGQSIASQDRARSHETPVCSDCARYRLPADGERMSSLDLCIGRLRSAAVRAAEAWDRFTRWFKRIIPKGLYARSLLIIIAPMVILQSVVAFVFMEKHWNYVTQNLSAAVVQDIAALIEVYKNYPQ